jgi:peptidoglycan/LPS O-acetylase OafA/YrhL
VNGLYAAIQRWLSTPVLLAVIAISALGVLRYCLYFGGMNYGDGWPDFAAGAARVCYSFFAGVLVWRMRGDRRVSTAGALAVGLVVAAILLAQTAAMPFDLVMVLAGFPLIVWLAARVEPGKAVAPVFINLGLASYGVYAVHTPVGQIIERLASKAGYAIPIPVVGLVFMVVLTGAVIWLDKHYDQPLRRWLLKVTKRKAAMAPAAMAREVLP